MFHAGHFVAKMKIIEKIDFNQNGISEVEYFVSLFWYHLLIHQDIIPELVVEVE